MNLITGSIVLYKSKKEDVVKIIDCFFNTQSSVKLYLIDNSPNPIFLPNSFVSNNVEYILLPANPGFGAAHNVAIKKAIENGSKYHFVINPDVFFDGIISSMTNYMDNNQEVGMLMPQILNHDGTIQHLPKLLPTPLSLILRKLSKNLLFLSSFIEKYELRNISSDIVYFTPILSGCFTMLRLKCIEDIGMYDDRFFMYFEDWDLSRRMHVKYKTVYYPLVTVLHGYQSGANKNLKLFKTYVKSAILYFNKYGWLFDRERAVINKNVLKQFENK